MNNLSENVSILTPKQTPISFEFTADPGLRSNDDIRTIFSTCITIINASEKGILLSQEKSPGEAQFTLNITTSQGLDGLLKDHTERGGDYSLSSELDACTVIVETPRKKYTVMTNLLVDRCLYEYVHGQYIERPDAFVRALAAIGHELYGNILPFLSDIDNETLPVFSEKQRISCELRAFSAGIRFLEDMIAQKEKFQFSDKMMDDLSRAMTYEREGFESWKKIADAGDNIGKILAFPKK